MRILLAVLLLVPALAGAKPPHMVVIDGSSSVYPITEAVAEEFQIAGHGRVIVGIAGTGGGFKKFCRGETDISQASRPISQEEMEKCAAAGIRYVELPVAFDALTVATSKRNDFLDCITVADLKKIWEPSAQEKIMKWSDVRAGWPDKKFSLYGAGSDSGTFDYFTEAVAGKAKASRGDYTASEDDNVLITGISNDPYALGYVPYAYYSGNAERLKAIGVDNGKGCVKPSLAAVQDGSYSPLARPLFIYVSTKAAERPEVKKFIEFYLNESKPLIEEVHYLPLPDAAQNGVRKLFAERRTGTVFGGHGAVGLPIHEILNREAVE